MKKFIFYLAFACGVIAVTNCDACTTAQSAADKNLAICILNGIAHNDPPLTIAHNCDTSIENVLAVKAAHVHAETTENK